MRRPHDTPRSLSPLLLTSCTLHSKEWALLAKLGLLEVLMVHPHVRSSGTTREGFSGLPHTGRTFSLVGKFG